MKNTGKESKRSIVLLIGICLWLTYIFQEEMAYYGIYTVFNYQVHEIAAIIPMLCLAITLGWFIYLLVKVIKKKCDKSDKVFLAFLCCLIFLQGYYIYQMSNQVSTTTVATVESVAEHQEEIKIKTVDGKTMMLKSLMLVNNMVEIKGQEYLVTYTYSKKNPNEKRLQAISLITENVE